MIRRVVEIQKNAAMSAKGINSHNALKLELRRFNAGKASIPNACSSIGVGPWWWKAWSLQMRKRFSTVWVDYPPTGRSNPV